MNIEVSITLKNNRGEVVTIRLPAGFIIEQAQTEYGVQNVALDKEYEFKLPPHSQSSVTVNGRCLNRKRDLPVATPGRITPFRYAGTSLDQTDLWQAVSTPKK